MHCFLRAFYGVLLLACLFAPWATAETVTASGSGTWDAITWQHDLQPEITTPPASGDDVVIPNGLTIELTETLTGTVQRLTISGGGRLDIATTKSFSVSSLRIEAEGVLTIGSGASCTIDGGFAGSGIHGSMNIGVGSAFLVGNEEVTLEGTVTASSGSFIRLGGDTRLILQGEGRLTTNDSLAVTGRGGLGTGTISIDSGNIQALLGFQWV